MDLADNANDDIARAMLKAEQAIRDRQAREQRIPIVTDRDCSDCGDPIGNVRLSVLPHATRCIDCQGISEHRGRA